MSSPRSTRETRSVASMEISDLRSKTDFLEKELASLQIAVKEKEKIWNRLDERIRVCEEMAGIDVDFSNTYAFAYSGLGSGVAGTRGTRGRAASGDTRDTESTLYTSRGLSYNRTLGSDDASFDEDSSSPNKRQRGGVGKRKNEPKHCTFETCHKMAHGPTYLFCLRHGGGYRCQESGCTRSAYSTKYCSRHGGGPRCQWEGCVKGAISNSAFCRRHGGGSRCQHPNCPEGARQGFNFCLNHGGFNPCAYANCPGIALLTASYCRQHNAVTKVEPHQAS